MGTKTTTSQRVRQVTLSFLLLIGTIQLITIFSLILEIHSRTLITIHKANGVLLFGLIITHIIVFRKNLRFYLFPNRKLVQK
ncbi:MAG: hypothetical protein ACP5F6_09805 [Microbacter sp.]